MIVVDTTILLYSVGETHPLAEASRRLVSAITEGRIAATTTVEVVQEFVHVRSRRRPRPDAVALGRRYLRLLSPLLQPDGETLERGLALFERHPRLHAFDAVLAAAALAGDADALVSADRAFAGIRRLRHIDPATSALDELIASA